MLTPLPVHGQSSTECVEAVSVLAVTGKYPLGQKPGIYDENAFKECEAPQQMQEIWAPYQDPRFARSCIVCTNVVE